MEQGTAVKHKHAQVNISQRWDPPRDGQPDPKQMETVGPRSSSSSLTYLLQSVWLTWTSALGLHLEKVVENSDTKFPAHILYPCVGWRSSVDVLWVCWRRRSKFSWSYQLSNLEIASRGLSWMNPQKCFSRGRKNNKRALWFLPFCKTMQAP